MNRIAHLALGGPNVVKTANFYKEVFGLHESERNYRPQAGDNPPDEMVHQILLSDGHMNLTIRNTDVGMAHFGFVVDNISEVLDRWRASGVTQVAPRRLTSPKSHHEVEIRGPEGGKIDVAVSGSTQMWPVHRNGEDRGKIQHIALANQDIVKSANFYKQVFGLQETDRKYLPGAGDNPPDEMVRRIYLWDGWVNLTICKEARMGMYHFGFAVDSMDETLDRLKATGASVIGRRPEFVPKEPDDRRFMAFVKCKGPEGVTIDLYQRGWAH